MPGKLFLENPQSTILSEYTDALEMGKDVSDLARGAFQSVQGTFLRRLGIVGEKNNSSLELAYFNIF